MTRIIIMLFLILLGIYWIEIIGDVTYIAINEDCNLFAGDLPEQLTASL